MKSKATGKFWRCYKKLPEEIKKQAKKAYSIFYKDPFYPSLHFKRVHSSLPIYAVRITKDYRAIGVQKDDIIIWFWIGSHADYEKLLKQIRAS